ncbi:uncharacterized protein BX663DRAFT_92947 [Cokeromyces recurvatus]|uniref:uncharacterized protein n=1 Tax=Cokeromyces recurvatus TaxID=90255 RepID=UPI0022209D6B|nr:uncharacterized protein BX663DRAFT_92947 [Cokeromyces recurvatus]KAI7901914.1 hypothetical protein BX663DRAFT_92947 [Cokeromyces recurvatus]
MIFSKTSDDTFLPEENDKLKAQIKELKRRLATAVEKERRLKRELIEEDLSYVTVSSLTKLIQDPTRIVEYELTQMQKEIFDKMMTTAEACCVHEMISYHRLTGRSVFKFKGKRNCIRLDTFYNKTYKEPYYIIYDIDQNDSDNFSVTRSNPLLIEHHTIPPFIHLDNLQAQFLPHNFNTFIRIVHAQIQAYVTKREILKEIESLSRSYPIKIQFQSEPLHKVEIKLQVDKIGLVYVDMSFEDKSSLYPTDVNIRKATSEEDMLTIEEEKFFVQLQQALKQKSMKNVFLEILNTNNHEDLQE